MRTSLVLILILTSLSSFATPEIQNWQTSKGARVFFVPSRELPMVDIQITFDAGSARDPLGKQGLAALSSSLLAEGADGLNADALSYEFERLGAVFGSDAGYDSSSVSLRSLSDTDKLRKALLNLRRILTSPEFPPMAIERQKKRFLTGIQQKKQSPATIARESFYQAVYGNHPYAQPRGGNEQSIKAISRNDIVGFHKKYYVARNAVISIVGDLDKVAAEVLAEELSSALEKGESAASLAGVKDVEEEKTISKHHPSTQTHILLGQAGIKRGDKDYFPLYVGNHILGGSGLVSLLFKEIREKRALSYSAYSYFALMKERGPFISGLSTRADQAEEALAVLKEQLSEFARKGPTEEQLREAKKNITGGFPLKISSNSDILAYVSVIGFYNLPLDYLDTFNSNVEAVSVSSIREAFRRHIQPDRLVAVLVGPQGLEAED